MPEEKPFEPTPSRLARAKRDGDVPRSRDVAAVASFACAAGVLFATLADLGSAATSAFRSAARNDVSGGAYLAMAGSVLVLSFGAAAGGALATALQGGGLTFRFPAPSLAKLNPGSGLKRMFGRDAALGAAKAAVVATAVSCAAFPAVSDVFGASRSVEGPPGLAMLALRAVAGCCVAATAVAASFAVADVIVERAKWRRRLRMSFEEVKREHRQSEGDPTLHGRRRQAHRDLIRGSIGRVRDAAFVVANPTHVAIALEYAPPAVAVPRVLVRAIDAGAVAVKERARALRIPIVENAPLARALLAATDVGDPIPRDAYGAVAAIVASLVRDGAIVS